jgi:predicted MPP superfamily phosphohydrolase
MHVYVFWRAATVPILRKHVPGKVFIIAGVVMWLMIFLARAARYQNAGAAAALVEGIGMGWLGILFLTFVVMLCVDIATGFGWFCPRLAPSLRGWALAAAGILSLIAAIQGFRPPIVQEYDVYLNDLPKQMDKKVILAIADLHLKPPINRKRLSGLVEQIKNQKPDFVFFLGDIFEGRRPLGDAELSALRRINAPLGVWAVLGNHEFHGGTHIGIELTQKSGWRLLRNQHVEVVPGFVLAGIDDLRMVKRLDPRRKPITQALSERPLGTTVLLSHSPQEFEQAKKAGVDLMLCGHTHGGQIWPFGYLAQTRYPLLKGKHDLDGMTVIVSRGAGTWGPRMRLWQPGEIVRLTLHRK